MTAHKRRVPRLYLERDLSGDKLALDEREAHYLGHVLRLKRGDELVAFNGRGMERRASVGSLQRRGAELELRATVDALPASRLELTLVQALPKSDAMDLIVQKATELGALAIVPVYTEFSVVKLDDARARLAEVSAPAQRLVVAIGPEGGFGASDWRRLDAARFARIGLGPRILR